jgi:hypothetical protein
MLPAPDPSMSQAARAFLFPTQAEEHVSGLSIEASTRNGIAGQYESVDGVIEFELEVEDRERRVIIRDASGAVILDSIRSGETERIRLFGGRALVFGNIDSLVPMIDGDAAALEELKRMPESSLIDALHSSLLAVLEPTEMTCHVLMPGEARTFATWAWGRTSRLVHRFVDSATWHTHAGHWFGTPVELRNDPAAGKIMLVGVQDIAGVQRHAESEPKRHASGSFPTDQLSRLLARKLRRATS